MLLYLKHMNKFIKISLIGMPSSGKTTIGEALAKKLSFDFIDLDTMVELREGISLIDVMNAKGADYFRNMEYDFLKEISSDKKIVISPAGSIIFQKDAMKWLEDNTFIIFLNTPLRIIEQRLAEKPKAVAGLSERGLQSICDERMPIYNKHANYTIDTDNKTIDEVVNEIYLKLTKYE